MKLITEWNLTSLYESEEDARKDFEIIKSKTYENKRFS